MDLVGIDLMPHVNASMRAVLPKSDAFHAIDREVPLIGRMIEQGLTGRKGKGGFYRLDRAGGERAKQAIDLKTGEYRPEQQAGAAGDRGGGRDLRRCCRRRARSGAYACRVLAQTLAYAATLVPEAADAIADIDEAMRLGYAWKWGPFELIDKLGPAWLARAADARRAWRCRSCWRTRRGRAFYRVEDGKRQFLGHRRRLSRRRRAPGRAAAGGYQAGGEAGAEERLGGAVGHRRRRGLLRVHLQDRTRSTTRSSSCWASRSRWCRQRFKALVIYNEGEQFLGRRQSRPGAVRRQHRGLGRDREADRGRAAGLQGAEIRALPGGCGAGRHGAGRRLRDPAACRRGAGACRDLSRAGRVRRRADPRLGRLRGDAGALAGGAEAAARPDAGAGEGVRDDQHGAMCRSRRIRRRRCSSCARPTASP